MSLVVSKSSIAGGFIGFIVAVVAGDLFRAIFAFMAAFAIWWLARKIEGAFESRAGICGAFLVILISTPIFKSVQDTISGFLTFFYVFILASIGFIAGELWSQRDFLNDDLSLIHI